MSDSPILLTGSTGYIGGRLYRRLRDAGHLVRCLARDPSILANRIDDETEVIQSDLLHPENLTEALNGCGTAFYLVHAMQSAGKGFVEREHEAARNFATAAKRAGIRRIIYLGGLVDEHSDLSPHMLSRIETGRILRDSGIPTVEFRASIVIGSGSLSFEMVRALVQRLPLMTTPKWVRVAAQPIGIQDLLAYLLEAITVPLPESKVYEIGGADRSNYADIMHKVAEARGLRRWIVPVPLLTPGLSSLWLGLVTPLYARVGRRLIDSVRHPSVVTDPAALQDFSIKPMGLREAIQQALQNEDQRYAETRWSDSLSAGNSHRTWAGVRFGSRLVDSRTCRVATSKERAFAPIRRIGGKQGWYYGNLLWQLRGAIDTLLGGVGMRRGRKDAEVLLAGEPLDCWRVETIEKDRRLRLKAEMKLPGRAWLEFEVTPLSADHCEIRQTAVFDPLGLAGLMYWYGIFPLHALIFRGMLRGIVKRAQA